MTQVDETELAAAPFRGIKRCALILIATAMLLAIAWTVWRSITQRQLAARIAAIRARHEPLDPADFNTESVSPLLNSAPLWKAAFAAVPSSVDCPSSSNLTYPSRFPLPSQWHVLENKAIVADAKALALARQASALPRVDWGPGTYGISLFAESRALTNVLGDAALYAHLHGNDVEALRRIHDLMQEAAAMDHMGEVIAHLIAEGQWGVAFEKIEWIAPELAIGAPSGSVTAPAARMQVRELINELADERDSTEQMRRSVLREQVDAASFIKNTRKQTLLLGPMLDMSAVRMFDGHRADIRASQKTNLADADAVIATDAAALSNSRAYNQVLADEQRRFSRFEDWDSLQRYFESHWRSIAERHAAAAALAVRLYWIDHHRWPQSLGDLVPDYLSAVPTNPYLAANPPMGFVIRKLPLPDGGERPMLHFGYPVDLATGNIPSEPEYGPHQDVERTVDAAGRSKFIKFLGQWRDLSTWTPPGK